MNITRRITLTLAVSLGAMRAMPAIATLHEEDLPDGSASYPTAVAAMRGVVAADVSHFTVAGYHTAGDGGAATWRRVGLEDSPAHVLTDAVGQRFAVADGVLRPEMFGARGGDADDTAAIRAAVLMAATSGREVEFCQPRYTISDAIPIPGHVYYFAIRGRGRITLVQSRSNCPIFDFTGEHTSNWTISGFRFIWAQDQDAQQRQSYAVRFASNDPHGVGGHFNFEITDCVLWNGFRGFGQRDDGEHGLRSPIWGARFSGISANERHSGAAIFLRTWGRAGQPNIRIDMFYARGDRLVEPAIVLEAVELAVLTSVEFNRGQGCMVAISASSNVLINGIRFEQVAMGAGHDWFIEAVGASTSVDIDGLSVQSMVLNGVPGPHAALVRASDGANVRLSNFVDVAWRSPLASRTPAMEQTVALVDCQRDGVAALGRLSILSDPAYLLARPETLAAVEFTDARTYELGANGALVTSNGWIAAMYVPGGVAAGGWLGVHVAPAGGGGGYAVPCAIVEGRCTPGPAATLMRYRVRPGDRLSAGGAAMLVVVANC